MENLQNRLVDKSIESFLLGIELYNKPTIRYRIEGFSFFIVNAWELMLKAKLLNEGKSIYYKDNPGRTLSISDTLRQIYTDKNTRIRLNLERIIDLRNISTHFITEDYEAKYAPLFQACVINYTNELKRFHNKDITNYISPNFLTLSVNYKSLSNEEIKIKYSPEIAEKLIQKANEIEVLSQEYDSSKFSINIRQNLYLTRKKQDADFIVALSSDADTKVAKVKELKDPADTHKYSFNNVIVTVNARMRKEKLTIDYPKGFNKYLLTLLIEFYSVKQNQKYAYQHKIGNSSQFTYSQLFIDFIIDEMKKDPQRFAQSIIEWNKKKITPGT